MAPTVALPHAAMLDCAITAEALQHGAKQQLMTFTASLLKYIPYTVATVQKHTTKVLYVNFILRSSQARRKVQRKMNSLSRIMEGFQGHQFSWFSLVVTFSHFKKLFGSINREPMLCCATPLQNTTLCFQGHGCSLSQLTGLSYHR